MKKTFTLFYEVNTLNSKTKSTALISLDSIFGKDFSDISKALNHIEQNEEATVSQDVINNILDFARTYSGTVD